MGLDGVGTVTDFLLLLSSGVFGDAASRAFFMDTASHLLHLLALHFEDRGLPSRHFVIPSSQYTPPWLEQHPLQSAYTVVVTVVRKIVNSMDMRRGSFFIILSKSVHFQLKRYIQNTS